MTGRREFTRKTMAQAFQNAGGACQNCGARLAPGNIHYDHILPCALGGEATLENCAVLCRACHGEKTGREDIPRIRKADRQRAKHIGAASPKRAVIPGSKASKWKKRLDGSVVRRCT